MVLGYKFVNAENTVTPKYKFVDAVPKKETPDEKAKRVYESLSPTLGTDIVSSIGKQYNPTPGPQTKLIDENTKNIAQNIVEQIGKKFSATPQKKSSIEELTQNAINAARNTGNFSAINLLPKDFNAQEYKQQLADSRKTDVQKMIESYMNKPSQTLSGIAGFADSATLGLLPYAIKRESPVLAQKMEISQKEYPKTSIVGELGGYAVPFGAGAKLAKAGLEGAGVIAKGVSMADKIKNALAIETVANAGVGAVEGLVRGEGAQGALNRASEYTGLGVLGAGVLGGLGAGVKAGAKALKGPATEAISAIPKTVEEAVSKIKGLVSKPEVPARPTAASEFMDQATKSINESLTNKGVKVEGMTDAQAVADRIRQRMTNEKMGTPSVEEAQRLYGGRQINSVDDAVNSIRNKLGQTVEQPTAKPGPIKYSPAKQSDVIDVDGIKNIDDLPNTEDGLKAYIAKAQEAQDRGLKINLQLFGEAKSMLKERRFVSNSIMNSSIVPDEIKANLAKDMPKYDPVSNVRTFDKAKTFVDADYEGMLNEFKQLKSLRNADDTALGEALIQKALQYGDNKTATNLILDLAEKGTMTGQATQALSIFKKLTPEGMLMNAQRQINKAARAVKQAKPELEKQFEREVKTTKEAMQQANKETTEAISKDFADVDKEVSEFSKSKAKVESGEPASATPKSNETGTIKNKESIPEEDLAKKIQEAIDDKPPRKINTEKELEKQMIRELYQVAKESPLPEAARVKSTPKDILKTVEDAIQNKEKYKDVWDKAKAIVQEKYKDNDNVLSLLDDYLNKKVPPTYSEGTLTNAVKQKLSELDINVSQIAKEYHSTFEESNVKLIDYIKQRTGLKGEDLDSLTNLISSRYKDIVKQKAKDILTQRLALKPTKESKQFLDKVLEYINLGAFDDSAIAEVVSQKLKMPFLSGQDAETIINIMKQAAKLPEGREKNIAVAQAMQVIANNIPADTVSKIKGLQRVNLLFNIKTMIRNILGNIAQATVSTAKDVVRAPIDVAISKVFGTARTVAMPSFKAQIEGLSKGLKEAIEDYRLGIDTFQPGGQYELPAGRVFKNKLLNKVDELTRFGLSLGDRPFYEAAYADSLAQQMKAAKISSPTTDMINEAIKVADERTYRDINSFTESFRKIREGLNFGQKFGIGNLAIPFHMTPANILKNAVEYSPASIARAIKETLNISKGTFNQRKFVDLIAKGTTGTVGLIYGGYELAKKGIITGASPEDSDLSAFQRESGRNAYAIKAGDKSITYDWAQPGSIGLAIGADMFFGGKNKKDVDSAIMNAISSGGKTLFQQSLLQGLQKMLGGYNPVSNIQDVLLSSTTQFVPLGSALKSITQFLDDTARSSYSPSVIQQKAINPAVAKIPGASQTLEPKVGTLGEEQKIYQGKNNFFNILLNPGFATEESKDPVSKEILRLYDESGQTVQVPRVADTKFEVQVPGKQEKETIRLTPKQYTEYQTMLGQETKKLFNQIINTGGYRAAKDEYKADMLKRGLDSVNRRVKAMMVSKIKQEGSK